MPAEILAILEAKKLYGAASDFFKSLTGKYGSGTAHVQVWSNMPKFFYEYVQPGVTAYPGEKNYTPMANALFDIETGEHVPTSAKAIEIYNSKNGRSYEEKARKPGERVTGEYSLTVVPVKGNLFTGYLEIGGKKYDKTYYETDRAMFNKSNSTVAIPNTVTNKQPVIINDQVTVTLPNGKRVTMPLADAKAYYLKLADEKKKKEEAEKLKTTPTTTNPDLTKDTPKTQPTTNPIDPKNTTTIKSVNTEISNSSLIILGIVALGAIFVFNKSKK